MREFESAALS